MIFGVSGLHFQCFLADSSSYFAYFGHVFGCSCCGAYAPPDPAILTWFSLFLVRSSANFAKKIQELAEDKAENPRTCRGQSREQNPYERLQENSNPSKLCSSKLLSLSQPSLLQKLWAAVLPPRGASIRRPTGNGVWNGEHQIFFSLPSPSKAKFLIATRPGA